jgi:uncharacterized membrane protein
MSSVHFILATFSDEASAKAELGKLKSARKEGLSGMHAAAEIHKDEKGKVHTKELNEFTAGEGAIGGLALGVVLGAMTGGLALLAGAAFAALGGIFGKVIDTGIPNKELDRLGQQLEPGGSAVVAVVDDQWVDAVSEMLKNGGASQVQSLEIPPELLGKLKEGAQGPSEGKAAIQMSMGTDNTIGTGNATAAFNDAMSGEVNPEKD